jgi:hypothetical protein
MTTPTIADLTAALAAATEERDAYAPVVAGIQAEIDSPTSGPGWADANFEILGARQKLAQLETEVTEAQNALNQARATAAIDAIVPAVTPLDAANLTNLQTVADACATLLAGARTRDSVAAAKAAEINTIDSPRVTPDMRFPAVDGYSLVGTRKEMVVELARIVGPIFDGLGDSGTASQLKMVVRGGNRLPGAEVLG